MKVYKLIFAIISLGPITVLEAARAASYTPLLREVLTRDEYNRIYPSFDKMTGRINQLQVAMAQLETLLSKTRNKYKRKVIDREIRELEFLIRQAD